MCGPEAASVSLSGLSESESLPEVGGEGEWAQKPCVLCVDVSTWEEISHRRLLGAHGETAKCGIGVPLFPRQLFISPEGGTDQPSEGGG